MLKDPRLEVARTLKLALIGSHGVGENHARIRTLLALLKKADHNVELVAEVARRSPFPINEGTTVEGQLWILHAQIAKELGSGIARAAPDLRPRPSSMPTAIW